MKVHTISRDLKEQNQDDMNNIKPLAEYNY